jgi:hypothetical protein
MANIGNGRIVRVCDLCGGVDDHPRHVIAGTAGGPDAIAAPSDEILAKVIAAAPEADRARLVRDLMDTSSSDRHLDCCAAAGCPNGLCGPQVAGTPGAGAAMLEHLMSLADPFGGRPDVVTGA